MLSATRRNASLSARPLALTIFVLLLLAIFPSSEANPNGASDCPGGAVPAVGGVHLSNSKTPVTGTLQEGGYALQIYSVSVTDQGPTYIEPGEYPFAVVQAGNTIGTVVTGFKGVLVRLESSDVAAAVATEMDATLYPTNAQDTSVQAAAACVAPILGLTHTDSSVKAKMDGFFDTGLGANATLYVDVTVVDFNNNVDGSQYWFTRFTFEVRDELPSIPTFTPKLLPTATPIISPAPTASPRPVLVPQPAAAAAPIPDAGAPVDSKTSAPASPNGNGNGTATITEMPVVGGGDSFGGDMNFNKTTNGTTVEPDDDVSMSNNETATTPATTINTTSTPSDVPSGSPMGRSATVMPVAFSSAASAQPEPTRPSPPSTLLDPPSQPSTSDAGKGTRVALTMCWFLLLLTMA